MAKDEDTQSLPEKDGKSAITRDKLEQSARREALGTGLRLAYQKVLNEPVPEEFSALLNRLSGTEGESGDD
ncbi:MAG: NepR family anti-sigma factor [Parvibaculum sp.]|uniref:NepR family anti-sigma factor n=1 Tax=Parvibaculum sp. TaxID=2024848 RepID=UPI002ABACC5B|nr:NepR family anti-sigma factor [Parvibaculum sp.]MDZ4380975.1 NepR family anti-sigma factor [Parvibaculum sp.]